MTSEGGSKAKWQAKDPRHEVHSFIKPDYNYQQIIQMGNRNLHGKKTRVIEICHKKDGEQILITYPYN